MRGPRQDDDSVIENPLKLGLIQANPLAIGLLHASRNTRKLKITAAAECDRALLERSCEPEELKGVKWYESYNAILRDPDATTRPKMLKNVRRELVLGRGASSDGRAATWKAVLRGEVSAEAWREAVALGAKAEEPPTRDAQPVASKPGIYVTLWSPHVFVE